ncbi:MAG: hypothetical protein RSD49_20990, partial [Hafnia sp.]
IVYVDREGQPIMEGMVVALAVTMNQRMHFNNFTTRICRFKKGELILDGASNWGFVKDYSAQEMQILHAGVDLTKLESDFLDQFGSRESFWRKEVSSQDAHDFYIAVVEQLSRQTVDYLDIKDSRQAKNILVKLLELSGLPDDKFKGKVDAFRLKFAAMQTRFNEACRDLSSMMDR